MSHPLAIGLVIPSNSKGGAQKIAAMAAVDLARSGHEVSIYIPALPYSYYFLSLKRDPVSWTRLAAKYAGHWACGGAFGFQEILDAAVPSGRVRVKFMARTVSRRELGRLDRLMVFTIAQVAEYWSRFPQARQVYVMLHTEEREHGHADMFRALRRSFQGKLVAISPFTARLIQHDVPNVPVVPVAVSPICWSARGAFDPNASRRDVLFHHRAARGGQEAIGLLQALRRERPDGTLTVWCRESSADMRRRFPGARIVQDCSERELRELYLTHSFLLFPSTFEGFGMPPIEASACGCIPILYPGVGGADLYAVDGRNAIHLSGDVAGTAQRVARLLREPSALRAMRAAASEDVGALSPDGYGQHLLEAAGLMPAERQAVREAVALAR